MVLTDPNVLEGGDKYSDILDHYVIYSLVNLDNGKRYIGRTKNPKKRIKAHLCNIKGHRHTNKLINKECGCNFGFEIIDNDVPLDEWEKEKYYMLLYRTYDEKYGYNANDMCLSGVIHLLHNEQAEEFTRESLLKSISAEIEERKRKIHRESSQLSFQTLMDEAVGNFIIAQATNNSIGVIEASSKIHALAMVEKDHEEASVGEIVCLYLKCDAKGRALFRKEVEKLLAEKGEMDAGN